MGNGVIYVFRNKITGKEYVGQTWNFEKRLRAHETSNKGCNYFYHARDFYGWESFEYSFLHEKIETQAEMDRLEIQEILQRNTLKPNGYNIKVGGSTGKQHPETIEKMRLAKLGTKRSPESIAKGVAKNTGKKRTDETRRRISEGNKGKEIPQEMRDRISKKLTGVPLDRARVEKRVKGMYDRILCLETGIVFESFQLAAKWLGVARPVISCHIHGARPTASGYHFKDLGKYNGDFVSSLEGLAPPKPVRPSNYRRVRCIETNRIYDTVEEARSYTGATNITSVCKGNRNKSGNLHWEYVNE